MSRTVAALFETRRDADTFVEHLVQEYGLNPSDVVTRSAAPDNSVGTKPAGADAGGSAGEAPLEGKILVSAQVEDDEVDQVIEMIEEYAGQRTTL